MIVALWIAAIIGFAVPKFWLALTFVLFNARQSPATDLFGLLVSVTCPPWRWNVPLLLIPLRSACLYAAMVCVVFRISGLFLRETGLNDQQSNRKTT